MFSEVYVCALENGLMGNKYTFQSVDVQDVQIYKQGKVAAPHHVGQVLVCCRP